VFDGGEVGPGQGNKRHGGAIGLTPSRLVAVAGLGRAPASGGDGTVVARPRSHGLRRGPWRCSTMRGSGSLRDV
jgi:hypothetical protein